MTDRPTNAPRGLEDVLAAHYFFALEPSRCAGCGEHLPCEGEPTDEHRAHVAAAIREWLTSEAVVEAAARAHWTAWSFNDADSHDITNAQEHNEHMTRAALAAVAGVV